MTVARYVAVIGRCGDARTVTRRRQAGEAAAKLGFEPCCETATLAAWTAAGSAVPFVGSGVAVGTLFPRLAGMPRVLGLDARATASIRGSIAASLLTDYWGNYVAFVISHDDETVHVLRPPFGELGCYYWCVGEVVVVASDVDLLIACADYRPVIDWTAVGAHLVDSELRRSPTCLADVSEVIGGNRLTVTGGSAAMTGLWSPWSHVRGSRWEDHDNAMDLRAMIVDVVGRSASAYRYPLLGLSGGLDSSIVAASLAAAGRQFAAVNFVTEDAFGDERRFARTVAAALGAPLAEVYRDGSRIDLCHSNAAHLPRPVGRSFAQESERIGLEVATRRGADVILRGGGGDNVFCYLQSVAPIADRLLTSGAGSDALQTAIDVSRLTGCSLWTAVTRGARRAWRSPTYNWPANTALLKPDAAAAPGPTHDWLQPPAGTLPGQAAHVALLLAMSNYMEGLSPARAMPLLSPLMAQPLVEFCLGQPSWRWCAGGRNRSLARRAFAHDLPPDILARRAKGSPDGFVATLFEDNRRDILAMLADGLLARHGLIDVDAVADVIDNPRRALRHDFARVMQLVDVEAWARAWQARASSDEGTSAVCC